jgi:uncharacterized membrane protein YphA (DoxX/SURF4 family)
MPPLLLIRVAIALVWIYEGLWCKILGRAPGQESIASDIPFVGAHQAHRFLILLGIVECAFGVWTLSGWRPWLAALVQTVVLVAMNTCGILWARSRIHDPAGMVLKNFVLVILTWVAAGMRAA